MQPCPCPQTLSGVILLWYFGRQYADLIAKRIAGAANNKAASYDFEPLTDGAALLKCSESGQANVNNLY